METMVSGSVGFSGKVLLKKILIICGVVSTLLYIAMNIFIPMHLEGYSITSQTVSELSAVGTPTRTLWNMLVVVYEMLLIAFGWGIFLSAGQKRALRVVGVLMITYGIVSFAWPLVPLHQRDVIAAGGATFTDAFHIVLSAVTGFFYMFALVFGAAAFGKGFRIYSFVTIVMVIVFAVLMGMDSPRMTANLPTPLLGVWERISIGFFLLWVMVLSITIFRLEKEYDSR